MFSSIVRVSCRRRSMMLMSPSSSSSYRSLFIQVESTPNPASLKFVPGREMLDEGASVDFANLKSAQKSPLARSLFGVDQVSRILISKHFIAVTINDATQWSTLKPEIFSRIENFFASGESVMSGDDTISANEDTRILDDDDDTVALIKELIETRIRPYVQVKNAE